MPPTPSTLPPGAYRDNIRVVGWRAWAAWHSKNKEPHLAQAHTPKLFNRPIILAAQLQQLARDQIDLLGIEVEIHHFGVIVRPGEPG